jgi:hypothetical protein
LFVPRRARRRRLLYLLIDVLFGLAVVGAASAGLALVWP